MTIVFNENVNLRGYDSTNIRMLALSPSAESIQEYTAMLQNNSRVGQPVLKMDDEGHNLVSCSTLEFGFK